MKYIVLGNIGSDAGYWVFENGRWVHKGGWAVDSLVDVTRGLTILGEAAKFKTPGLSDRVSKVVSEFVDKEMATHLGDQLKEGGVVVINVGSR